MTVATKIIGLNIREQASGRSEKLGILPRGARIELGERSPDGKWGKIKAVLSGTIAPVQAGGTVEPAASTGWVYIAELDPGPPKPPKLDDLVAPERPVAIKSGDLVGYLGEYQQYPDALAEPRRGRRPMLHLEVFTGEDLPGFITKCRAYARTLPAGTGDLFVIDKGAKLVPPSRPSGEVPANQQVTVVDGGAGPWVKVRPCTTQVVDRTTLGAYTSATKTYANGSIFTGTYVGATGTRTTSEAQGKNYPKREVLVPTGTPVWAEKTAVDGRGATPAALKTWNAFPLQLAHAVDPPVSLARVMSRAELERTAAGDRLTDPEGNKWYKVIARVDPDANGVNARAAWVCEKNHPKVGWQSPWAWPGFEHVEEGAIETVDMWSATLLRVGAATTPEVTDFKARADKVDKSALLQKLYELIDTNKNGIFEPQELRAAMTQPQLVQALSRVVTKYESEWGGDDSKWTALDPLVLEGKPEWEAEKQRIKDLRWWAKVAPKVQGFPADPVVYHIHPIGLIENFHTQAAPAAAAPARRGDNPSGPPEKSGRQWVSRFMPSRDVADLVQPFRGNLIRFFAALTAGGVGYTINTTLRPPQRSYLMYYAREVVKGLSPDRVPAFVPEDDDEHVNIDWAHRDGTGKPDLVAARRAARDMDAAYGAAGAIGRPYRSNHNKGQAVDVRFSPAWGAGKTVVDATGKSVAIGGKQGIINVGATFNVFHWNYAGAKSKADDPHWSATGN